MFGVAASAVFWWRDEASAPAKSRREVTSARNSGLWAGDVSATMTWVVSRRRAEVPVRVTCRDAETDGKVARHSLLLHTSFFSTRKKSEIKVGN